MDSTAYPQDSWLWGLWQGLGMGSAGSAGGRLCRQHPRPLTSTKYAGAACCAPWTCVEQKQGLQWRMIEVYSSVMSSLLWTLEGNIRDIGALLTFLQELCGWQDNMFHFTVNKLGLGCYKFGRDEWLRQEEQPYSTNCLCTLPKHSAPLPVPEMYSLSCRCVGESVVWGLFRAIYPGMPNIFKKKRLVFGWVFFPPFVGRASASILMSSREALGTGCQDSGCCVWLDSTVPELTTTTCVAGPKLHQVGLRLHCSTWSSSVQWGGCFVVQDMKHLILRQSDSW